MQRLLLIILPVFLLLNGLSAQEYHILHVKGEIKVDGVPIKPGDKINADKEIQFTTPDAVAAALSPDKGRYIIRVDKSEGMNSDLIYILSATVAPVRGGMSTRAGDDDSNKLRSYFGSSPFVWVGETIQLEIPAKSYPMDDENYFLLRFQYKGNVIDKKLDSEGNILVINKSSVFSQDGEAMDLNEVRDYEFYYHDGQNTDAIVTPAFFIFLSTEEVNEMFIGLEGSEKRYKEMADILSEFYGMCDPKQLELNLSN